MTDHEAPDPVGGITDEELAALALAADPDEQIGDDAVTIWELLGARTESPLPTWYMPAPMSARRLNGWHRRLVQCSAASLIASFVVITASGLCNTYGQLHF
jgi:hypothetical protein